MNVLTIKTYGKSYAQTGEREHYCVRHTKIKSAISTCLCTFPQHQAVKQIMRHNDGSSEKTSRYEKTIRAAKACSPIQHDMIFLSRRYRQYEGGAHGVQLYSVQCMAHCTYVPKFDTLRQPLRQLHFDFFMRE